MVSACTHAHTQIDYNLNYLLRNRKKNQNVNKVYLYFKLSRDCFELIKKKPYTKSLTIIDQYDVEKTIATSWKIITHPI